MIRLFKISTKYALYALTLKTASLWAQHPDSIGLSIKSAIVHAGWLQDWRGIPTKVVEIRGGSAEVAGYTTVDKRIRFFKNLTFEMDVYKERFSLFVPGSFNELNLCGSRQDDEMSVITGTWSVKMDSIYLQYRKECIYNSGQYSEYQSLRELGKSSRTHPKEVCKSNLRRKETYLWRDGRVCLAGAADICFR